MNISLLQKKLSSGLKYTRIAFKNSNYYKTKKISKYCRIIKSRIFGIEFKYRHLSTEGVFDNVYKRRAWGRDESGLPNSGDGSHERSIVDPYIDSIKKVVSEYSLKTAVDLGCGDFAVGSKLYDSFDNYLDCDISSLILEQSRALYQAPTLEFQKLNLAKDDLPVADVAFVRQVLQHLSNKEITGFVDQINKRKKFKFLIVTEHLPSNSDFTPNIDKRTGPSMRLKLGSGVVLHREPFNLRYKEKKDICFVSFGESCIKTTLYIL